MKVPFFDWKQLYLERRETYLDIIDRTLSKGGFVLFDEVHEFERALAKYLGVKHVVGLSDATNAILLGLRAMNLERGAEVIIPSHSFVAAPQSIHFAGCVPVPCELAADGMACVDDMAKRITPRTRALMPVQVNGRSADMDPMLDLARKHGLAVVEDSAQALGAKYKGRMVGTIGLWGVFSFYPSKTLGSFGDAGALVTNDDEIGNTVRRMRNHGANAAKVVEADYPHWGTNARIDNLHAAILLYKLGWYDDVIQRRRAIASRYHEAFAGLKGLVLPPPPGAEADRFDVFQNYEMESDRRDALRAHLASEGVGTIIQWGGLALHQMHGLGYQDKLPKTDRFFQRSLLLPLNHFLSDEQVGIVIDAVRKFHA